MDRGPIKHSGTGILGWDHHLHKIFDDIRILVKSMILYSFTTEPQSTTALIMCPK